jgi:hypothetical protein
MDGITIVAGDNEGRAGTVALAKEVIALIAAAITLIALVAGFLIHVHTSASNGNVNAGGTTIPASVPNGAAVADPPAPSNAAPAIYHQDPLTLVSNGPGADLDAPADNHSWDVNTTDYELEYAEHDHVLGIGVWSNGAILMAGQPSYDTCNHASGFNKDDVSLTKLKRYPFFCVKTSGQRLALVVVKSVTTTTMQFVVTVYAKDSD